MHAVERQCQSAFPSGRTGFPCRALALDDRRIQYLSRVLPQVFLGGGQLDFALFAEVVADQIFQRIEDARREDVHAEVGQVIARRQARRRQVLAGDLDA